MHYGRKRRRPEQKRKPTKKPVYTSGLFDTLIKKCSVIDSLHVRQQGFVLGVGEYGAVFADINLSDIALTALADTAFHAVF